MRHSLTLPVIAVVSVLLSGCMSGRDSQELGKAFGEAFSVPFAGITGAQDLSYTVGSFRRKTDRWPRALCGAVCLCQRLGWLFIFEAV